jgi:integrase/recombinase XerD
MNSITQCIDSFLNYCKYERNFSFHTLKAYCLDLKHFSRFTIQQHSSDLLIHVTRSHLREYTRNLNGYKPRTQRRKLAAIKSMFGFLEREGFIESNPARAVRLDIRIGRTLPRTVSLPTLQSLFEKIYEGHRIGLMHCRPSRRTVRDIALFELLFASGMRVSEISHLCVEAVDLSRGSIMVKGKGNKERQIPICDDAVRRALTAYVALDRTERGSKEYLFTNRFGRRLSEQSIRMALKRHAKAAGLERITPHVFRHTVATMLLEQGVDLRFIQTFLGHSSIVTTTIYAHVNDKSQRDVLTQRHPRRLIGGFNVHGPTHVYEG